MVEVPDVLRIRERRQGEDTFANLSTGLSPGEQSAAILTLALETRRVPLILDQPEDELEYSYVVPYYPEEARNEVFAPDPHSHSQCQHSRTW